jgi:TetR/AcrR family transcriptional regulator
MARTRALDYDDKRRALMAVAARLFATHGFDRTSISEIANQAQVSKALLYHYYPGKSALLYDIISVHLAHVANALAEAEDQDAPPEEHLFSLIRATLFAYRDADALHKVQINELDKLDGSQQQELRTLERAIVTTMIRAVRRLNPALLAKDEAQLLKPVTMSLFGVLNWSYLWFRDGGPLDRDDYARFVTRLFVEGVGRLTAEDGRERRGRARAASREPEGADR